LSVPAVESTPGVFGFVPGTATTGETKSGPTTSTSNSQDKDMFLQLLVAQMKYQDPSNPADSSEFLAQTAQFTALEKMQLVADQTSQLVALQVAFGASSMVGRTVTYPAADGTISTGVVDSVQFGATGPVLKVDGNDVFLAQVQSVANGDS
jgi:flagellar basal-body rod modification protein FlgD